MMFSEEGKPLYVQDLKVGDYITTMNYDGKVLKDKIVAFNKQQADGDFPYIQVAFLKPGTKKEATAVLLSPNHLALVGAKAFESKKAKTLKRGDRILLFNGKLVPVLKVDLVTHRGAFSPVSESGRYLANGVIISSYEEFPSHIIAHIAFSKWDQWTAKIPWIKDLFQKKVSGKSIVQWMLQGMYKIIKKWHT
jgi:intein/homing endonuclease